MKHSLLSFSDKAVCCFSLLLTFSFAVELTAQSGQQSLRKEESYDYYRNWLKEDVVYIVTDEEKAVFEKLTTTEEREQFIEQFWKRRDPDWGTSVNEFKEEHYRRIAYANERFAAGEPGWRTDRGRIYIIHGAPDEIESYPTGGEIERPLTEGGGFTTAYPFERWYYRHIGGLGSGISLEFVDKNSTNQYSLALGPEEKDALLNVPGGGETVAEAFGLKDRRERPYFYGSRDDYPSWHESSRDNPFERYRTFMGVQQPKELNYKDLREVVNVAVQYSSLPVRLRMDHLKIDENQTLIPITLEFENKNLTFAQAKDASSSTAKVAIYGILTTMSKGIVLEFDDDVTVGFPSAQLEKGLTGRALYQKTLGLLPGRQYKLTLVVKDLNSGNTGVVTRAVQTPVYKTPKLASSSLLLSDNFRKLTGIPAEPRMFVWGDVLIHPSLDNRFEHPSLGLYLELYNFGIDQATLEPSLELRYRISQDGKSLGELVDTGGHSTSFSSGQRVVLLQTLPMQNLLTGKYLIEVLVSDRITGDSLVASEHFEVVRSESRAEQR
jgi:GWxTD domain-containing protein